MDISQKYKELLARREKLSHSKMKVEAALAERKKNLRDAMEECKSMGYNPDTLAEDLKKLKEVLVVKLGVFEADLQSAEDQINPMVKEIE